MSRGIDLDSLVEALATDEEVAVGVTLKAATLTLLELASEISFPF